MSFYDEDSWSAAGHQASWDQQQPGPPSRSGTGSSLSQQAEPTAFASQFEEIDRATDNLMKSGKWMPGPMQQNAGATGRRDSMPTGQGFDYANPRSGLQGFYAGQRFPGGRQSEAEQMLQAKRRMAAQRERELRNYHQEQQYNRTVSGAKPDRSMSPTTMSEEDRRELIARQHRALYGDGSNLYSPDAPRPQSQDVRVSSAGRGPSPLAFDPFGAQAQGGAEGAVQMPPRDRPENAASPASNPPNQQAPFNLLSDAQQRDRASSSSPGASPPLAQGPKNANSGVAPIGTRPAQAPGAAPGLNKRSTTPLTPSSLSYGFNASDAQQQQQQQQQSQQQPPNAGAGATGKDERSTSAASNPSGAADKPVSGLGAWGSSSGVWGSGKNTLAVQPSVWG